MSDDVVNSNFLVEWTIVQTQRARAPQVAGLSAKRTGDRRLTVVNLPTFNSSKTSNSLEDLLYTSKPPQCLLARLKHESST